MEDVNIFVIAIVFVLIYSLINITLTYGFDVLIRVLTI